MKVLVVEDNISARKLLRITFEHYQCSVIEAQDGVEGLEMAGQHKPDIIISDALMPRMDGFQMLRAIKADPALKAIPFVFYSSTYTGQKEEKLATSLGANAFVTKPAEPETLWEKTREIMRGWEERQGKEMPPAIDENDEQYLKEYSRIVAAKLEEKVHELEEALRMKTMAEEAVKEQEQELATIFENAPFSMLLLDGDRRLRRVNGVACSFAGSKAAEMIGERGGEALGCVHARDVAEGCGFGPNCGDCSIRKTLVDTYETGRSHQQIEKVMTIGDKCKEQVKILLVSTIRVMVRNRPMVLLSLQDITEQRKLEEQLRQAQRIESIGTLAGGIAHDFNNVLTVIMGFGQVTMMSMAEDDPLRANMEQILAAAERASHLTKDLLLFGRKQLTDKKAADLNGIVKTVEKFLVRIVGESIASTIHLAEGTMPIFADAHQLEQVLVNLATNARDAMSRGGVFTIITARTTLDEAFVETHGFGGAGCTYALLSVADSGVGMDEQTRQHIFDPFFTTKEAGKGTGLGMAVVYGIIKQHDGYIDICSEPGAGTTFNIYLPLIAPMADAAAPEQQAEMPVAGEETILLAENDRSVREMMASVLRQYGYEVIVAFDGEDAVRKFLENRERIKLLLFDLVMPNKSGKEAYDEISLLEPGMKVVFASGNAPEIMRQKELLGDAVTVTSKPFSPMLLLQKVRAALDQGSAADTDDRK